MESLHDNANAPNELLHAAPVEPKAEPPPAVSLPNPALDLFNMMKAAAASSPDFGSWCSLVSAAEKLVCVPVCMQDRHTNMDA